MRLITDQQRQQLIANGIAASHSADEDHFPVVKLFTPDANATWLLSELDPLDTDCAFGLCDLGLGHPELGYVLLSEIAAVRGRFGLSVERDLHFVADRTLGAYADEARLRGAVRT